MDGRPSMGSRAGNRPWRRASARAGTPSKLNDSLGPPSSLAAAPAGAEQSHFLMKEPRTAAGDGIGLRTASIEESSVPRADNRHDGTVVGAPARSACPPSGRNDDFLRQRLRAHPDADRHRIQVGHQQAAGAPRPQRPGRLR